MRSTTTSCVNPRPSTWPSVEKLREKCDEVFQAKGTTRAEALRKENMSQTTFDRLLREGLSDNPREKTVRRLEALGVLGIVPRR